MGRFGVGETGPSWRVGGTTLIRFSIVVVVCARTPDRGTAVLSGPPGPLGHPRSRLAVLKRFTFAVGVVGRVSLNLRRRGTEAFCRSDLRSLSSTPEKAERSLGDCVGVLVRELARLDSFDIKESSSSAMLHSMARYVCCASARGAPTTGGSVRSLRGYVVALRCAALVSCTVVHARSSDVQNHESFAALSPTVDGGGAAGCVPASVESERVGDPPAPKEEEDALHRHPLRVCIC